MKFKHLKCRMRRFCATVIAGCIVLSSAVCTSSTAFAENNGTTAQTEDANELKYYLGSPVNTGKDNGFLDLLYTFSFGCQVDYNKAVEYYTIATEKCDFDCSDDLKHFKKKLFGGYTYIK